MGNIISDHILKKSSPENFYKIVIRNESSQTVFSKPYLISIIEFKNDGLSLEIPINICQKGHLLSLFFLYAEPDAIIVVPLFGDLKEAKFQSIGKVTNIEKDRHKENYVFIDITFTQYDVLSWKKVIGEYEKGQEEINGIFMNQHNVLDEE